MQSFYLASTLLVLFLAWKGGAVPERIGVALLVVNYLAAGILDALNFDGLLPLNDALLLAGLLYLSWRHRRWWILLAAAMQVLIVVAHYSYGNDPHLTSRTDVLYRWLLGVIGLYALVVGVVERWLSGEPCGGWPRPRSLGQ